MTAHNAPDTFERSNRGRTIGPARTMIACLALAMAFGTLTGPAVARAGATSFAVADPAPDNGGSAPDVTTVVVNNDSSGQITFQVNVGAPFINGQSVGVYIDADQNPATGDPHASGADYLFWYNGQRNTYDLQRWGGTAWVEAPSHATTRVTGADGTTQLTLSVNRSEVGVSTGLNFWVWSVDGSGGPGHEDSAPDTNTWNYQLQGISPLRLSVVLATSGPRAVKAGGTYTTAMLVRRSDTGSFLGAEGTIGCSATLGGKSIAAAGHALVTLNASGRQVPVPVCVWRVPLRARGRMLRATMILSYQGATVTHRFQARVG